jgi:hypothetical protein
VNSNNAFWNGGLADNYLFFGSSTAETVAAANAGGSWNGGSTYSPYNSFSWIVRGGGANYGTRSSVFASDNSYLGAINTYNLTSHRTILSGY